MVKKILLLVILFCGVLVIADETAVLDKNWKALQSRKIDLLPVPKEITFQKQLELKKVAIIGNESQPYFKVICDELESRFTEIGSKVTVTVSAKKIPGAYNIVLSSDRLKNKNFQSYSLEPVSDGVILKGKENNLYAAMTLRYLIQLQKDKTIVHQAKVLDWPDFPERQTDIYAPWVWRNSDKDPVKNFERVKPVIRWALHHKVTAIRDFAPRPYYKRNYKLHRLSKEEARALLASDTRVKSIRMVSDYAASLGIRFGIFNSTFALGDKTDHNNPEYQQMMYYRTHDEYHSWARVDMHHRKADKILDYMERTGIKVHHCHSLDGGACDDPEYWSLRDKLTKEKFGDDRAAADTAVFKEYMRESAEQGIQFEAIIYPYHGSYLSVAGIRKTMGMPDTPQANAVAEKFLNRITAYAKRMDKLMPGNALFTLREDPQDEMKLFYDMFPNRKLKVYWDADSPHRDIGSNIPQELRSIRTAYYKKRAQDIYIHYSNGGELHGPALALFAEYAWNSAFPGWELLDRSRNPVNYDLKNVAIAANRAACGYYGEEAGKLIAPVYDKLFSFRLTVNPKWAICNVKNPPKDLLALCESNHKQLLTAIPPMEKAAKLDQKCFKPDSYPEFVEIYLRLKAAKAYSIANVSALQIEKAAFSGDFAKCKKIYEKAMKELSLSVAEYRSAYSAMRSKSDLVRPRDILQSKWNYQSFPHMTGQLFIPDFKAVEKIVQNAYDGRKQLFAKYHQPEWIKGLLASQKVLRIPGEGALPVEHWLSTVKNNSAAVFCQLPPQLWISYNKNELIIKGLVRNPDLAKQKVLKQKYDEWPHGDSIEILIYPRKSTIGMMCQFVVDPNGNVCSLLRKKIDGIEKHIYHNFGPVPYKVEREKDRWSFELRIPFKTMGAKPESPYSMIFGYNQNGKVAYFSRPLTGSSFIRKDQHIVYFTKEKCAEPTAEIRPYIKDVICEDITHASGSGTMVRLIPALNTFRPLYNASMTMRIEDLKGNIIYPEQTIFSGNTIPAFFQSTSQISCQLEKSHSGFYVVMTVKSENFATVVKKIPVGKVNLTVPGPVPGSKAYTSIHKGEKLLSHRKGELSFSVKPNFVASDHRDSVYHLMAYCGNYIDNKNRNCMYFSYSRQWERIYFRITSSDWTVRTVNARYVLPKDKWTDLKFTWDMTAQPVKMTISVNGKVLSGKITDWKKENTTLMKLCPTDFNPVFGGMKNGLLMFDGAIGNIKY